MAVDSRDKRMSMIGFGSPDLMMGNPVAGVPAADRAMLLHLYSGIALSSAVLRLLILLTLLTNDLSIVSVTSTDLSIVSVLSSDLSIVSEIEGG